MRDGGVRLDHAVLRFFYCPNEQRPVRATQPPKVAKARSRLPLWEPRRKAEKEDSVDNYPGNNPLHVNQSSSLPKVPGNCVRL